jgi:hypothetical protein
LALATMAGFGLALLPGRWRGPFRPYPEPRLPADGQQSLGVPD